MINLFEIENYIKNYYDKNCQKEIVYHNINHVVDVVNAVRQISLYSHLSQSDSNLVIAAAWFHDIGHLKIWEDHEELSANFAMEYFRSLRVPDSEIDIIIKCIKVTALPHTPITVLEKIICDADISHVGSELFFEKSNLLRMEIEIRKDKRYTDDEWLKKNIDFVNDSIFFTDYANKFYEPIKKTNLEILYESYKTFSKK